METHFEKQVKNALVVIKDLQLEDFIRSFDGKDGFMWSSDSRVTQIGNKLMSDGHSGASFAFTLRECQRRLIEESEPKIKVPPVNPPVPPLDENNKKAIDILTSEGIDKGIEHMFKHPVTGEQMDYATMRSFYG